MVSQDIVMYLFGSQPSAKELKKRVGNKTPSNDMHPCIKINSKYIPKMGTNKIISKEWKQVQLNSIE